MLLDQLRINSRYNFRLYGAAHLSAEVKRATLVSTSSLNVASLVDPGLAAKHVQVLPSLPEGTVKDPSKLTYLIFTTEANQTIAFAYNWLIPTSIEEATANKASLDVRISSPDDLPRIISVLTNAGFAVENSMIS